MRRGFDQHHPRGFSHFLSQVSPTSGLLCLFSFRMRHSRRTAKEAEASLRRPPSGRSVGLPPNVGDPTAERVEEWPVGRHDRNPRHKRPVAMEDDKVGDENYDSLTLLIYTRRCCPLRLRGSRSPG